MGEEKRGGGCRFSDVLVISLECERFPIEEEEEEEGVLKEKKKRERKKKKKGGGEVGLMKAFCGKKRESIAESVGLIGLGIEK